MKNEQRNFLRENNRHSPEQNSDQRNRSPRMDSTGQPDRSGPFTFTAGWLGSAFDRTRIDKREAEERRSRNM